MKERQWAIPVILFALVALAISGCSSPTPTPQPPASTSREVVIAYWQAIDRGDYDSAYGLAYPAQNISKQQWIDQHRAMWGDNGTYITLYNFTVTGNSTLDPATFPGSFSAIESVIVQTNVSYYGKNTTGISQFAAVKADDGWKFYGYY